VWLWHSHTGLDHVELDLAWQAFLRRFDIEHTFRMLKQTLGWTTPKLRSPEAADHWTWLLLAVYTQLRLARDLTTDLRRPWGNNGPPSDAARHGSAGVPEPASTARLPGPCPEILPARPGPGRPAGLPNHRPATRHDIYTVPSTNTQKPQHGKKTKSSNPRPRRTG
jgi:hypothetical protein